MIQEINYDKSDLTTGILHLGIGRFHRAHQADLYHEACNTGRRDLGVIGVSLRSQNVIKELSPRNFDYHLWVKDSELVKDIKVLKNVLFLQEDRDEILSIVQDQNLKVITLTVTEKGYLLNSVIYPILEEILLVRMQMNLPLVIISCDNLPDNSHILKARLFEFTKNIELKDWTEKNCAFPSSMVDRIVPATTEKDRSDFHQFSSIEDEGVVTTETFSQWYIEDFNHPLKSFIDIPGVSWSTQMNEVEKMKLRLLNAAHSYLAYAGQLKGYTYVHDAVQDPQLREDIQEIWREARFTITRDLDLDSYCEQLLKRFENNFLNHKLFQIGHDGSQKIPVRIQNSIKERREVDLSSPALEKAVVAWKSYISTIDQATLKKIDPNFIS